MPLNVNISNIDAVVHYHDNDESDTYPILLMNLIRHYSTLGAIEQEAKYFVEFWNYRLQSANRHHNVNDQQQALLMALRCSALFERMKKFDASLKMNEVNVLKVH
jgi:hypothetical protein